MPLKFTFDARDRFYAFVNTPDAVPVVGDYITFIESEGGSPKTGRVTACDGPFVNEEDETEDDYDVVVGPGVTFQDCTEIAFKALEGAYTINAASRAVERAAVARGIKPLTDDLARAGRYIEAMSSPVRATSGRHMTTTLEGTKHLLYAKTKDEAATWASRGAVAIRRQIALAKVP